MMLSNRVVRQQLALSIDARTEAVGCGGNWTPVCTNRFFFAYLRYGHETIGKDSTGICAR